MLNYTVCIAPMGAIVCNGGTDEAGKEVEPYPMGAIDVLGVLQNVEWKDVQEFEDWAASLTDEAFLAAKANYEREFARMLTEWSKSRKGPPIDRPPGGSIRPAVT